MTIIYNDGKPVDYPATAIALGTFDGIHIAHTEIINKAVEFGIKHNIPCGVMLFDDIPANSFSDKFIPRLTKPADRNELLSYLDFIYVQDFNQSFASMTPEEFVIYIKNVLKAKFVSVGYNYRFGRLAAGDASLLKKLCSGEGIEVCISDKMIFSGSSVSSTRLRRLISDGNVKEASELLGRNFFLTGRVMRGYRNGHKLGAPTANLELDTDVILPLTGVYAGICVVDGIRHKCVINVGDNPTFNAGEITVEAHLLGFSGELYEKQVKIEFADYLRGEIKFASDDELAAQILTDIKRAESILADYE